VLRSAPTIDRVTDAAAFLDEIAPNWRYEEMMEALHNAETVFAKPPTESERSVGWTDDINEDVRDWVDRFATAMADSYHPPTSMGTSWGRWLMDVPGRAFNPRVSDWRREQLLTLSNSIHKVQEIERLYLQVCLLMEDLAGGVAAGGGPDHPGTKEVQERLRTLRQLLASGRRLSESDSEQWRDSLPPHWAHWMQSNGEPWETGDPLPRFWVDQPGELRNALGGIDGLFNAITCSDGW
jgi:hypothetical protein